jgi:hypothetical protein
MAADAGGGGPGDHRAGHDPRSNGTGAVSTVSATIAFNITPATLPGGARDFVDLVVPELQRRGLFRTEYEGRTLRENLGLRPVVNRYSAQRRAAE